LEVGFEAQADGAKKPFTPPLGKRINAGIRTVNFIVQRVGPASQCFQPEYVPRRVCARDETHVILDDGREIDARTVDGTLTMARKSLTARRRQSPLDSHVGFDGAIQATGFAG
jgi:hypothetical protein